MKLLNVGCGANFHPEWMNVDVEPLSPLVRRLDVRKGLDFPDGTFEACYSSHVIEHLRKDDAESFLKEICRVLRPGGCIRLATPDLEQIVLAYLSTLDNALKSDAGAAPEYDWMMLELLDQAVRTTSGGGMGRYLQSVPEPYRPFIVSRIGFAAMNYWKPRSEERPRTLLDKLLARGPSWYTRRMRTLLAEKLVRITAGREAAQSFREGRFRSSGEIHQWMYDRFSLRRLMERAGFIDVRTCTAFESRISGFDGYHLDVINGEVRKPDSLFMEGIRA